MKSTHPPRSTKPDKSADPQVNAVSALLKSRVKGARFFFVMAAILVVAGAVNVWAKYAESTGRVSGFTQDAVEAASLFAIMFALLYESRRILRSPLIRWAVVLACGFVVVSEVLDTLNEVGSLASVPVIGSESFLNKTLGKGFEVLATLFFLTSVYLLVLAFDGALLRLSKEAQRLREEVVERRRAEREREEVIGQLQESLAQVKTLRGLLPLCSSCKRIRDSEGGWNDLTTFIKERSEADFSSSLCPDCTQKLYPGLPVTGVCARQPDEFAEDAAAAGGR